MPYSIKIYPADDRRVSGSSPNDASAAPKKVGKVAVVGAFADAVADAVEDAVADAIADTVASTFVA
jgi:hypothetical protein